MTASRLPHACSGARTGMVRTRGMTLLELLVAMALLATLGVFLSQLMRNSFDLYSSGERRGEVSAMAKLVLDLLVDDLATIDQGPLGRCVIEANPGSDGGSRPALLVRIVRSLPNGERGHPVMRHAGMTSAPAGGGMWSGTDSGPGERGGLIAPGNVEEVCWALLQDEQEPAGVLTLYRGVHTPALEAGSFFDADTPLDGDSLRKSLAPVSNGILGLNLLCWGPGTRGWEEAAAVDAKLTPTGALTSWDSTRGILSGEQFNLAVGPQSLNDTRDDIFPLRIRVILSMARPNKPDASLVRALGPADGEIAVDNPDRLPPENADDRMVRVGGEWMEIGAIEGARVRVSRARRRTAVVVAPMPPGTPVFVGRVVRTTIETPVREPLRLWDVPK